VACKFWFVNKKNRKGINLIIKYLNRNSWKTVKELMVEQNEITEMNLLMELFF
jgi:hypothetical protein